MCQDALILRMYILFTKIIETFWSGDVTDIQVLAHFEPKIDKDLEVDQVFVCWIVLNIF